MGQPVVDISGRARLSCRLRAAQWLFKPTNDVDDAGREFLLAQLLTTPLAALMGSFCALTIELVAWHPSGKPFPCLFIAVEVTSSPLRWMVWPGRGQRNSTHKHH